MNKSKSTQSLRLGESRTIPERVSSVSLWGDQKWVMENATPGFSPSHSTFSWSAKMPGDTGSLTDSIHSELLQYFRTLVWTLLNEPNNAEPLAPTRLNNLGAAVRMLAAFMITTGRSNVGQLDRHAVDEYISWLPTNLSRGGSQTTQRAVAPYLDILTKIYKQGEILTEYGFPSMAEAPFNRSVMMKRKAREIAGKADGMIFPLPDEFAIPMMNSAYKWLGARADDVVRMVEVVYSIEAENTRRRKYLCGKALVHQGFSNENGKPWHDPLFKISPPSRTEVKAQGGLNELRRLFDLVATACAIVLQFSSGMRSSELCGLEVSSIGSSDPGECLSVRKTEDGQYELFCINGVLSKTEAVPEAHEWVVGIRPAESSAEVPAARALEVAAKLNSNWQKIAGKKRLFLQASRGFPFSGDSISEFTNGGYNLRLRKFFETEVSVEIPERGTTLTVPGLEHHLSFRQRSDGHPISSHMIRKLYANFAYVTDPRLVEALRVQYGHSSLAMTYQYTQNPLQKETVDEVARSLTLRRIMELVHGEPSSGRAGRALSSSKEFGELKKLSQPSLEFEWLETAKWIQKHDLRYHECAHGGCLNVSPTQMRCREIDGSDHPLNDQSPNFSQRSPGTCIGCKNFIMMSSHRAFWIDRYLAGVNVLANASALNIQGETLKAMEYRTQQAKSLLSGFGDIDLESLIPGSAVT